MPSFPTVRIVFDRASEKYTTPEDDNAMPAGLFSVALVPSAKPAVPLPATVETHSPSAASTGVGGTEKEGGLDINGEVGGRDAAGDGTKDIEDDGGRNGTTSGGGDVGDGDGDAMDETE